MAQGALAIHAARKLHGDIKPSSVMVTPEGRVVSKRRQLLFSSAGRTRELSANHGCTLRTQQFPAQRRASEPSLTDNGRSHPSVCNVRHGT